MVTEWRARHELPFEHVYVADKVLAVYETDENHEVHPLSGSVSYRNQWAVTHCDRVGKNAIRIDLSIPQKTIRGYHPPSTLQRQYKGL